MIYKRYSLYIYIHICPADANRAYKNNKIIMLRLSLKKISSYVVGLSILRSAKGSKVFSSNPFSISQGATCTIYLQKNV